MSIYAKLRAGQTEPVKGLFERETLTEHDLRLIIQELRATVVKLEEDKSEYQRIINSLRVNLNTKGKALKEKDNEIKKLYQQVYVPPKEAVIQAAVAVKEEQMGDWFKDPVDGVWKVVPISKRTGKPKRIFKNKDKE